MKSPVKDFQATISLSQSKGAPSYEAFPRGLLGFNLRINKVLKPPKSHPSPQRQPQSLPVRIHESSNTTQNLLLLYLVRVMGVFLTERYQEIRHKAIPNVCRSDYSPQMRSVSRRMNWSVATTIYVCARGLRESSSFPRLQSASR